MAEGDLMHPQCVRWSAVGGPIRRDDHHQRRQMQLQTYLCQGAHVQFFFLLVSTFRQCVWPACKTSWDVRVHVLLTSKCLTSFERPALVLP